MPIELEYPDGSRHTFPDGTTGFEVAQSIGPRLAAAAVAVELDGQLLDLHRPLPSGGKFSVVTDSSEQGRSILRHSAAHVLAQAVLSLFPDATFAIGPPIEDGFYYDFDIGRPFTPEDLERIEAKMMEIIAADQPFVREAISREEALELFADHPFKLEIIRSTEPSEVAPGEEVTVYRNNGFVDLCRGPHVPSTGRLKAVKLLRTAGAYWRGDEKNPQLQRIYGTAWEDRRALEAYLHRLEEAEKRDHRRLGPELDLFSFPSELGAGLAVWHGKGGMLRKLIEDHSRRLHERFGFEFVFTPHLARSELWRISGHLDFYADAMYPGIELDNDQEYRVKPMNCPFHILIYKSRARSYRDLPMRLSELGGVYRYERSGVIHGLLRARGFTQDDSHTFTTREGLRAELDMHLEFVTQWLHDFGFDQFDAMLSTRDPSKSIGDEELWDEATEYLRRTLEAAGMDYQVEEGEGAFYGPKIDINVRDAIGRRWQVSTIQVDFFLPDRFGLEYTSADNRAERPVMVHCAKAGSIERFIGVLTEHYAGAFPMWLAPVQATIVPVADRHLDYADTVQRRLRDAGLRVEVDRSGETVGEKIRRAITTKHPVVLVVGDKDVEATTVGVRRYGEDSERRGVPLDEAVAELTEAARGPR
ncbi:MAG: threonine--tRNA ligase [Acidimicrobiia bacterium]|mgnify:FL=1